jgi:hypothetical protein
MRKRQSKRHGIDADRDHERIDAGAGVAMTKETTV